MMNPANIAEKCNFRLCAECAVMGDDCAEPHEMLAPFGCPDENGVRTYRCLICNTHHVIRLRSERTRTAPAHKSEKRPRP